MPGTYNDSNAPHHQARLVGGIDVTENSEKNIAKILQKIKSLLKELNVDKLSDIFNSDDKLYILRSVISLISVYNEDYISSSDETINNIGIKDLIIMLDHAIKKCSKSNEKDFIEYNLMLKA